jgi:hypothetical protein
MVNLAPTRQTRQTDGIGCSSDVLSTCTQTVASLGAGGLGLTRRPDLPTLAHDPPSVWLQERVRSGSE